MSLSAIANLRELQSLVSPRRREIYAFSDYAKGIPRGAITEISGAHGSGKTELALRFIAENPKAHVAWVEDQFTAYPCAFAQHGVELGRVLFAEAGDQALWTTLQMLRSGIFGIIVLSLSKQLEQIELRRLQLASEQAHTSLVLLTETPTLQGAWPIALQLEVNQRRLKSV